MLSSAPPRSRPRGRTLRRPQGIRKLGERLGTYSRAPQLPPPEQQVVSWTCTFELPAGSLPMKEGKNKLWRKVSLGVQLCPTLHEQTSCLLYTLHGNVTSFKG